jgi:hypothetical protein
MADVTTCRRWYELNLAALRLREMYRADGVAAVGIGLFLWRIPGLFGARVRGGLLFPEAVTLMWEEPRDEVEEDDRLLDLGLELLGAFELPEFSGDNITHLYHDADRTTYCEAVLSRARGMTRYGLTLSSHLPGPSPLLLKTVRAWKSSPLDRPEAFPVRCVGGSVEAVYEAHRDWLADCGREPIPTSRKRFDETSARHYRMLRDVYVERGLWVEARPWLVKQLLRDKGLKRARPS